MSDKKTSTNNKVGIDYLVEKSPNIKQMIADLKASSSMSVTGIVNFVVNHENPLLVEYILKQSFSIEQLFNGTVKLDAVELQHGKPGKGLSVHYFDELIYGTYQVKKDKEGNPEPDIDEQTGVIRRKENGLVTRSGLRAKQDDGGCKDRILLISNVDYSLDWCKPETPGKIDTRALFLLDKFRHPMNRLGCVLLFITNEPLDLPFKVNTIEISPVSEFEVKHILNLFIKLYKDRNIKLIVSDSEIAQIVRKLAGLTYSESCDTLGYCFLRSIRTSDDGTDVMNMAEVLKLLRTKINKDLMADGFGLTQLTPRPWEDYICPSQSNFTHDVNKLMRDFREVDLLTAERKQIAEDLKGNKDPKQFQNGLNKISRIEKSVEALRTRMPHIIVLYGQGGVGKCLGKGTPVLMFDGSIKNVEDIKEGEILMGPDSKPRNVLSTTRGIGPLYNVEQKNGISYVCNDKHILSLKPEGTKNNNKTVFVPVEEYVSKSKTFKKTHYGWKSGVEFPETVSIGGGLSKIPVRLKRKKGHDNPQKRSLKCGIDVNPIGEGEYFGFTVDGDHQFLLGDFTVTHNSAFPVHLAGLLDMDVWDFNINATHSKWIGQGSEQMRSSLDKVSATSHIIIRIDEYDRAMGSTNERGGGMHEAHKQVESEFMNWLQNSQEENMFIKRNIFVILTTNHVENITGPMLRSGRTDLVIDIGSFDSASMMETFKSCARRMNNRGVTVVGFETPEDLQAEIDKLDLEKLSELAMTKKFTVRDIEMLIIEMGSFRYYYDKYADERGIPWTTEAFVKILENSEGSVKGASTGELKLGDRDYYKEDVEDIQIEFGDSVTDVDKLKETKGFKEE